MDELHVDGNSGHRGHVPMRWVTAVFMVLAALVYGMGLTASPDHAGIAYQSLASVAILLMFTGVIFFCVIAHRQHVGTAILGWPGWRPLLIETAIAIPVAFAWLLVLSALAEGMQAKELGEPATYEPVIIAPVAYCLVGFTLAPVAEEMLYRGVLYGSLRRWMRPAFAFVLQALVFGLMHRHGLVYMSMAFATGLLLMGLRLWRRTLWSPILVHAAVNAISAIPLLVVLLVPHTVLGVSLADTGQPPQCTVTSIVTDSPAQRAGLQVGDVITAINDQPIVRATEVSGIIAALKPGDTIHLTVLRAGRPLDHVATLRRPAAPRSVVDAGAW